MLCPSTYHFAKIKNKLLFHPFQATCPILNDRYYCMYLLMYRHRPTYTCTTITRTSYATTYYTSTYAYIRVGLPRNTFVRSRYCVKEMKSHTKDLNLKLTKNKTKLPNRNNRPLWRNFQMDVFSGTLLGK